MVKGKRRLSKGVEYGEYDETYPSRGPEERILSRYCKSLKLLPYDPELSGLELVGPYFVLLWRY